MFTWTPTGAIRPAAGPRTFGGALHFRGEFWRLWIFPCCSTIIFRFLFVTTSKILIPTCHVYRRNEKSSLSNMYHFISLEIEDADFQWRNSYALWWDEPPGTRRVWHPRWYFVCNELLEVEIFHAHMSFGQGAPNPFLPQAPWTKVTPLLTSSMHLCETDIVSF